MVIGVFWAHRAGGAGGAGTRVEEPHGASLAAGGRASCPPFCRVCLFLSVSNLLLYQAYLPLHTTQFSDVFPACHLSISFLSFFAKHFFPIEMIEEPICVSMQGK